jgi:hypothetical protein
MATFNGKEGFDPNFNGHGPSVPFNFSELGVPEAMLFSQAISFQFRSAEIPGAASAPAVPARKAEKVRKQEVTLPRTQQSDPRVSNEELGIGQDAVLSSIAHACPQTDVRNTSEFASQILSAYTLSSGTVRLAGCQLEDIPIIRMTWLHHGSPGTRLINQIVDQYGQPVSDSTAELLQQPVVPLGSVAGLERQQLSSCKPLPLAQIRTLVGDARSSRALTFPEDEFLFATVVWCKQAVGKVRVTIGSAEADIPFSGLAKGYASGQLPPPPFQCPHSGIRAYAICITDAGEIAAVDAIALCEVTGKRVLKDKLRTCSVTGVRALAEHLTTCSVSGENVLADQLKTCVDCKQLVSPKSLLKDRCSACLSAISVSKDDPAMARILDEYPELDHWRFWKLSETRESYILTAVGILQSLRIVIDRNSLDILQLGGRSLPFSRWQPLAGDDVNRLTARR